MNNTLIFVLLIIGIGAAAYFVMTQEEIVTPATPSNEPAPVAEDTDYVGLSVSEAEAKAEAAGVPFRVVMKDGQPLPTTEDYRPGRINATVEAGVVTAYSIEGNTEPTEPAPEPAPDTETGDHDAIIGMTVDEAQTYAETNDVDFRVGRRDGEALPVTMDFRPGRITAEVEDGLVVGYSVEG